MPDHDSATAHVIDLPPPYTLVTLRKGGNALAHARAIADEQGAGTLVWAGHHDVVEFAVVLEPDMPLEQARLAIYAGMNALADALATHAPPSRPISFEWPDTIRIDGVLVGGGRLEWPEETGEDETPAWMIFSAMIRMSAGRSLEPGQRPFLGALDELGFEEIDAAAIIGSFSRHLMIWFEEWNEAGFAPVAQGWLDRNAPGDTSTQIADNGDLLMQPQPDHPAPTRHSLAETLVSCSWLDPSTGMPWL